MLFALILVSAVKVEGNGKKPPFTKEIPWGVRYGGCRDAVAGQMDWAGERCGGESNDGAYSRKLVPWNSDGGSLAWFDPSGSHGSSFADGNGSPGEAEIYYPNQQSARLMWCHDHALGDRAPERLRGTGVRVHPSRSGRAGAHQEQRHSFPQHPLVSHPQGDVRRVGVLRQRDDVFPGHPRHLLELRSALKIPGGRDPENIPGDSVHRRQIHLHRFFRIKHKRLIGKTISHNRKENTQIKNGPVLTVNYLFSGNHYKDLYSM